MLASYCCCKLILRFYPWCAGTEVCYILVLKKLKPKGRNRKLSSPTNGSRGWTKNLNFGILHSKQKSHRFISVNTAREEAMQTKVHFLKINIWFGMAHGVEEENIVNVPGLWGLLYTWIPFPVVFPLWLEMLVRGGCQRLPEI